MTQPPPGWNPNGPQPDGSWADAASRPTQYPQYPPPPGYGPHAYPAPPQSNNLGTAGFVTGLLGLLLFWTPFVGFVLSVLGIVFGSLGMSRGKSSATGTGLAIAGLVLGIVGLVAAVIAVIVNMALAGF